MIAKDAKIIAALLLSVIFISCSQNEEPIPGETPNGAEITTTISVTAPEVLGSRAVPEGVYDSGADFFGESGMPSIGNVDLGEHSLTFTVGIYVKKTAEGATEPTYTLVDKQSRTVTASEASFDFRLIKGRQYHIVAYADFEATPKDDLANISFATETGDKFTLNDELKDAFFASQEFTASPHMDVVLKRPFGKLRLIARDFNTFAAGALYKIKNVKVTYHTPSMLKSTSFNAITGEFNDETQSDADIAKDAKPVTYAQEYDDNGQAAYAAVFTMYLPANRGTIETKPADGDYTYPPIEADTEVPQSWMYPFTVEVTYEGPDGATYTHTREYKIDIPVKRNWLTTVDDSGFWTDDSEIKVTIDHRFDGFINVEKPEEFIETATELQAAIDNICAEAPAGRATERTIVLANDIDARDRIGFDFNKGASNKIIKIHLDLNGYTITTDDTVYPANADGSVYADGLFQIDGVNCQLFIDDSSETKAGGLKLECTNLAHAYPLIYCIDGGQVTINRGYFISDSQSEVVYIRETEAHRTTVQGWVLTTLGIKAGSTAPKPTDPKVLATIERNVKKWSAAATINGGWFENGFTNSTDDVKSVLINPGNARAYKSKDPVTGEGKGYWADYSHYWYDRGYPEWTKWGEYVNQPFSFLYINGGSFVNFNPTRGDNIVGNIPDSWIGDGHTVLTETYNGRIVYTVVPKNSPEYQ